MAYVDGRPGVPRAAGAQRHRACPSWSCGDGLPTVREQAGAAYDERVPNAVPKATLCALFGVALVAGGARAEVASKLGAGVRAPVRATPRAHKPVRLTSRVKSDRRRPHEDGRERRRMACVVRTVRVERHLESADDEWRPLDAIGGWRAHMHLVDPFSPPRRSFPIPPPAPPPPRRP